MSGHWGGGDADALAQVQSRRLEQIHSERKRASVEATYRWFSQSRFSCYSSYQPAGMRFATSTLEPCRGTCHTEFEYQRKGEPLRLVPMREEASVHSREEFLHSSAVAG